MKKIFILSLFIPFILAGCGNKNETDFKAAQWGTSIEEVIQLEKENGNDLYTEDLNYNDDPIIVYENLIIDGHAADVEYTFSNEVNKFIVLTSEKFTKAFEKVEKELANEDLTEEEQIEIQEKFEKDNEDLINEFNEMPDTIQLNDYVLISGEYWFYDIDDNGKEELFNTLVSKYGEPSYGETPYNPDEGYSWLTERTNIMFLGNTITYQANYEALEEFMMLNNKKKKTNDSDL